MTETLDGGAVIAEAIRRSSGPALCAYLTAGYPTPEVFRDHLSAVAETADVVEVGVPFTDPLADGQTIQRAGRVALDNGVTLQSILDLLGELGPGLAAPYLLMGYYNPFLAMGLEGLADRLAETGCSGLIVPDLPLEESEPFGRALRRHRLALVQLVTPTTPQPRMVHLVRASQGFVYAVTVSGTTGGTGPLPAGLLGYLDRVRGVSPLPVMAGFGIRTRAQVDALASHADGVVVGSALIEAVEAGDDPAELLSRLRE